MMVTTLRMLKILNDHANSVRFHLKLAIFDQYILTMMYDVETLAMVKWNRSLGIQVQQHNAVRKSVLLDVCIVTKKGQKACEYPFQIIGKSTNWRWSDIFQELM